MAVIKKRYIVDESNRPVGVLLDLSTFRKIEELIEDKLLGSLLDKASKEKLLNLEEAQRRYSRMKKRQ